MEDGGMEDGGMEDGGMEDGALEMRCRRADIGGMEIWSSGSMLRARISANY
jgi:hypothetical protein